MKGQKGQRGGSSAWRQSFYANSVVGGPAAITRATLENIDNAVMFKPFSSDAVIPTGPSVGIIPTGQYLLGMPTQAQSGGGRQLSSMSVQQLRRLCNKHGMSCKTGGDYLTKSQLLDKLRSIGLV